MERYNSKFIAEVWTIMWLIFIVIGIILFILSRDCENKVEFKRGNIISIRVDDDSEYHITYEINGKIKSAHDINSFEIVMKSGKESTIHEAYKYTKCTRPWAEHIPNYGIVDYYIVTTEINKIQYFED